MSNKNISGNFTTFMYISFSEEIFRFLDLINVA